MVKKKERDLKETEEERLLRFKKQMDLLPIIHARFRWVVVGAVLFTVLITILQLLFFR